MKLTALRASRRKNIFRKLKLNQGEAGKIYLKAGLNMLTKCIALELGSEVCVKGIGLGFVESPLVHKIFSTD